MKTISEKVAAINNASDVSVSIVIENNPYKLSLNAWLTKPEKECTPIDLEYCDWYKSRLCCDTKRAISFVNNMYQMIQ